MRVIALYSIKGGVGKTTAAVNLADAAARHGTRVLLWDLDAQGAATYCFRVRPHVKGGVGDLVTGSADLARHVRATDRVGVDLVPADVSLRHLDLHLDRTKKPTRRIRRLLDPLRDRYDLVVLDCPPGVTLATEAVFAATDVLVVPVVPSTLSRRTLTQLTDLLAETTAALEGGSTHARTPAVWPFVSMIDRRRRLHHEVVAELTEHVPALLPTAVPTASVVERIGVERAPLAAYEPRHPATLAFEELWAEIARRLWFPPPEHAAR